MTIRKPLLATLAMLLLAPLIHAEDGALPAAPDATEELGHAAMLERRDMKGFAAYNLDRAIAALELEFLRTSWDALSSPVFVDDFHWREVGRKLASLGGKDRKLTPAARAHYNNYAAKFSKSRSSVSDAEIDRLVTLGVQGAWTGWKSATPPPLTRNMRFEIGPLGYRILLIVPTAKRAKALFDRLSGLVDRQGPDARAKVGRIPPMPGRTIRGLVREDGKRGLTLSGNKDESYVRSRRWSIPWKKGVEKDAWLFVDLMLLRYDEETWQIDGYGVSVECNDVSALLQAGR